MNYLIICCSLVFFSFSLVQSVEVCDYDDLVCLSRAASYVYKALLKGKKGYQTIEPLKLDTISGRIPGFKYILTNATLSPMKNCEASITYLGETTYEHILRCSQLTLRANVIAKGRLGPVDVDDSDFVTITAADYTITTIGEYNLVTSKEDQTERFLLSTTSFTPSTKSNGYITFKTNNNFGLTNDKGDLAAEYIRDNWKVLAEAFLYPTINDFVSFLIINKFTPYLASIPKENLIPKEEKYMLIDY